MANIQQIAKKAGVSAATVSRVLNNHPYVSEEKRVAVEKAMKELDYIPNSHAIHLIKGKTQSIGVLIPCVHHPFFSLLLEGMGQEALKRKYRLILCQTANQKKEELECIKMLRTKEVDGIIFGTMISPWEEISPWVSKGFAVSCENMMDRKISSIFIDHGEGIALGFHHLYEKGHRQFALCIGREYSVVTKSRERAFRQALKTKGIPVNESWIFKNQHTLSDGKNILNKILSMKERPTAIITGSDLVAAGIITEARRQGLSIPDDLAVIGFDNQSISEALEITTIEQPIRQIGQVAFQTLYNMIKEKSNKLFSRKLDVQLIVRSSS